MALLLLLLCISNALYENNSVLPIFSSRGGRVMALLSLRLCIQNKIYRTLFSKSFFGIRGVGVYCVYDDSDF